MQKYVKKPLVIEAVQMLRDNWDNVIKITSDPSICFFEDLDKNIIFAEISTLEGRMRANEGDYIIRGIKGELYPCKADIFEASYDKVEDKEDE